MGVTELATDTKLLPALYRSMYRIRRTEEEIAKVYPTDKVKSPIHLAIGQEAVAVGVCEALAPDDIVFGTYRSHAVYLAKGGDLKRFLAELYGKATGCGKGKGGSMHVVDVEHGVMGTSAVVASTIPQAVGYAYAVKLRREHRVVVSFFGDGAVEEGVFHESLNFAQLKKLPVLFVCENNQLAIHSRLLERQAHDNIWERAAMYGIPSRRIERSDVFNIHKTATQFVDELRHVADGPRFMECVTSRWKEHVGPSEDWALGYRTPDELTPWIQDDQLPRVGGRLDEMVRQRIEQETEDEIAEAFAFAEASPFPDAAELYTDMLAREE